MKEIDKSFYCIHGKALDKQGQEYDCKCCGNHINLETREMYGNEMKYCKWCITAEPLMELLI
jgi:hypothetical protein